MPRARRPAQRAPPSPPALFPLSQPPFSSNEIAASTALVGMPLTPWHQVRGASAFVLSAGTVHHVNGAQLILLPEMWEVLFLRAFRINAWTPVLSGKGATPLSIPSHIFGDANPAAAPATVFDYDADAGSHTVLLPLAISCTAVTQEL